MSRSILAIAITVPACIIAGWASNATKTPASTTVHVTKASAHAPNAPRLTNASLITSDDPFFRSISLFEGKPANAGQYANTIDGFQSYLSDSGISDFTARELTTPNHPEIAKRLGYTYFVPPQKWWSRGAALALLAQRLHRAVGAPIHIRNWWRPADYNRQPGVDGANGSDHITATAMDIDYASAACRAKAEQLLRTLNAKAPWLHMSLGLGAATTHVGLDSPRGHREWHYAGYKPMLVG